jgi:hypothetical protein
VNRSVRARLGDRRLDGADDRVEDHERRTRARVQVEHADQRPGRRVLLDLTDGDVDVVAVGHRLAQ